MFINKNPAQQPYHINWSQAASIWSHNEHKCPWRLSSTSPVYHTILWGNLREVAKAVLYHFCINNAGMIGHNMCDYSEGIVTKSDKFWVLRIAWWIGSSTFFQFCKGISSPLDPDHSLIYLVILNYLHMDGCMSYTCSYISY